MSAAATLDLVQRLYLGLDERDPYPPMLAVLLSAFAARQGFVVVAVRGDAQLVVGAQRGLEPTALEPATHEAAWRALLDGLPFRTGDELPEALRAALPCAGEVAVLVARHQDLGESLWVVARGEPVDDDLRVRGAVLAANLDHAGVVALTRGRAPKGSLIRTRTGDLGPLVRPLQQKPERALVNRVNDLFSPTRRPPLARVGASSRSSERPEGLPERALRCARLAARGWTDDEIAVELSVSTTTVSRDLRAAYRAFGVRGRRELNIAALVDDPDGDPDPE